MKLITPIAIITSITLTLTGCQPKTEQVTTIGIIQTASHPALDAAREGFKAELTRIYSGKIRFIEQNAEGNASQAQSIAKSFSSNRRIDAIYAIASLAAQTAAQVEKKKPIFIDAVTDPKALGILEPQTNVCGSTDRNDAEQQVRTLKTLMPNIQRVVILYNPSEINSKVQVNDMKLALSKQGLHPRLMGVLNHSEIKTVVTLASREAEILWVPADNLLVSAMPLVSKTALAQRVPVMASDVPSVSQGALIAQGVDYRKSGIQTAQIAARVLLKGEKPSQIGVIKNPEPVIHLNQSVVEALHLKVPEQIQSQAQLVGNL